MCTTIFIGQCSSIGRYPRLKRSLLVQRNHTFSKVRVHSKNQNCSFNKGLCYELHLCNHIHTSALMYDTIITFPCQVAHRTAQNSCDDQYIGVEPKVTKAIISGTVSFLHCVVPLVHGDCGGYSLHKAQKGSSPSNCAFQP